MLIWQQVRHAKLWACGPMPPTEINIQTGGSLPFSREILPYGPTLDIPLFVKSPYDPKQKASLLAEKTSLAHTLELSSREHAVVASAS
jgi:hypothetical protein